ncbi:MAG: IPT/TIG domain-containing protein [Acidobacteriota bacterium]
MNSMTMFAVITGLFLGVPPGIQAAPGAHPHMAYACGLWKEPVPSWCMGTLMGIANLSIAAEEAVVGGTDGLIAFYQEQRGDTADIYIMNSNGSGLRRLTTDGSQSNRCPAFSFDGRQMAFTSARGGIDQIHIMNADGSNQRRVTHSSGQEIHPAWSPDGKKIVFCRMTGGVWQIFTINTDGTGEKRLTNTSSKETHPWWSPDGKKIVFGSNRSGSEDILVMNADGSRQTRLTSASTGEYLPCWSPDGSRIAYTVMLDPQHPMMFPRDLFIMNADGPGVQRITDGPGNVNEDGEWSPDGKRLVFQSDRTGRYQLYVLDLESGAQTRLTTDSFNDYWPAWGTTRPTVATITSQTGKPGKQAIIYGMAFSAVATQNVVTFGQHKATVSSASMAMLAAKIPGTCKSGITYAVKVKANGQTSRPYAFTVK